ncbi:hypothetical protein BKK52_12310 [Rodentibacter trehalosifermentans]|uniref:Uncharacterized protein n=1 Tax=Rodentibacter trehalosifermentans TaxID=1908263 RepID=A0A1V3IUI7_9PAST|nr:hypothetical protein [Rodentibacter trehalosifermentans]OOF45589.1 hypothetical protein BKK52_12310 [Rodentibacter trehalosifermentans]
MKANSEYFYDPMRAFYDGGADYLTVEKHRLVVIAKHAYATLFKISCGDYGNCLIATKQIEQDMTDLTVFRRLFENAKEFPLDKNYIKYRYELDYDEQIKGLDKILLKYVEFLSSK